MALVGLVEGDVQLHEPLRRLTEPTHANLLAHVVNPFVQALEPGEQSHNYGRVNPGN